MNIEKKNQLAEENIALVHWIVKKYSNSFYTFQMISSFILQRRNNISYFISWKI